MYCISGLRAFDEDTHKVEVRQPEMLMPLAQANIIVDAIDINGRKVKKILFKYEGHGCMRADTIKRVMKAKRDSEFYEDTFGINGSTI